MEEDSFDNENQRRFIAKDRVQKEMKKRVDLKSLNYGIAAEASSIEDS